MNTPKTAWVVGGGTAGHIEPALAVGEALRRLRPEIDVRAVGTPRGMESRIVPERGFTLELVDPVPLPRKVNTDLFKLPYHLVKSIAGTRKLLRRTKPSVIVGFGGYACVPVYLAMMLTRRRPPIVVHEANASAGLANKLGVRVADAVMAAVPGSGLAGAEVVGNPVRDAITGLDRAGLRAAARSFFGLREAGPVVLVFGGSQGAASLNRAFEGAADDLRRAGVGVIHATGEGKEFPLSEVADDPSAGYAQVSYIKRMDFAYAAADLVVCRSGAMTVAEVSATGLPAVFVPLPIGNGEQALNAKSLVDSGAALQIADADFDSDFLRDTVIPLATDPEALATMTDAAMSSDSRSAADKVAHVALTLMDDRS